MNSEMCFCVLKADLLRYDLCCTVNKEMGFVLQATLGQCCRSPPVTSQHLGRVL